MQSGHSIEIPDFIGTNSLKWTKEVEFVYVRPTDNTMFLLYENGYNVLSPDGTDISTEVPVPFFQMFSERDLELMVCQPSLSSTTFFLIFRSSMIPIKFLADQIVQDKTRSIVRPPESSFIECVKEFERDNLIVGYFNEKRIGIYKSGELQRTIQV